MNETHAKLTIAAAIFGLAVGLSIGVAWLVSLLWNATVAASFGWPVIGTWTAWGLMWLLSIAGRCAWRSSN